MRSAKRLLTVAVIASAFTVPAIGSALADDLLVVNVTNPTQPQEKCYEVDVLHSEQNPDGSTQTDAVHYTQYKPLLGCIVG